ncbi:hypothetical protein [Chryseobacterium hagamense]|uniref:Uncharacterized protein n=1 Tax=Chryseobacterium hagamense TaxID=395935 RepID=A0A511YLF6_9FLAO|nr:hypothetical protein [Chryseobacterium hagamense]GEN76038.1 hypothetical protein CHA01nite_17780 [Chryseobacterium hagamense]
MMKNIRPIPLEKYSTPVYESVDNFVYRNTEENNFVTALSFELEDNEDSQYPLEDLLDRFNLYISDFIDPEVFGQSRYLSAEFAGGLGDVRRFLKSVVGKSVYNTNTEGENGETYVKLIIE